MVSHQKRIENLLSGLKLDRVPVALWRHFPVDDQTPEGLARATINFQNNFDFDFVKVTPPSSYCVRDWGMKDEWRGSPEGTRDYLNKVIYTPEDWRKLPVLAPDRKSLGSQLSCLKLLNKEFTGDTPVVQTIFNPLSQAKNLVGKENLLLHLRLHSDALHAGLRTITDTILEYLNRIKSTGISGIFFAVQHAQYNLLTEWEYREFGTRYDLEILQEARTMWFNILHIHGTNIMFNQFIDYPVQVINWHDQETSPSLDLGKDLFPGVVCGGLDRDKTILLGTGKDIQDEAHQAINITSGERFILGTGCVIFTTVPYGNIKAVRNSVEKL